MGIDAQMAIKLRDDVNDDIAIANLNERVKTIHDVKDLLVSAKYDKAILIHNVATDLLYPVSTGLSRYYSIGYERGPCLRIITQIEWLRAQPEVEEVYYWGDTHDEPQLWTKQNSVDLMFYFFEYGYSRYRSSPKETWEVSL